MITLKNKIIDQWNNLPVPENPGKKSVMNVSGTNAWLFKDYFGAMGFLLSGVSSKVKFPKFENLQIKNRNQKIVERPGLPDTRLNSCLEINLEPFCDSMLLIRILDTMTNEEPSGRFESSLLLDVINRVLQLVKRLPPLPPKQEVVGAWGELWLLLGSIKSAGSHYDQSRLINGWESSPTNRAIIDFLFPHLVNGLAIEVKTSTSGRIHHFHGYPQVSIPEGFNHGWIASIYIVENQGHGKKCADLVSLIQQEFVGTDIEVATIFGQFTKKVLTRGPACLDERFGFNVNSESLKFVKMEEVPRPILSPGVKDVEWTSELDDCNEIESSFYYNLFPNLASGFL